MTPYNFGRKIGWVIGNGIGILLQIFLTKEDQEKLLVWLERKR